jgi:hypothetical protein
MNSKIKFIERLILDNCKEIIRGTEAAATMLEDDNRILEQIKADLDRYYRLKDLLTEMTK